MKNNISIKKIFELFLYCLLVMAATDALATGATASTFGAMANKISDSFSGISKLIAGGSYIAGIGFSLGAIMKFKQHKDNPTQIPIGTPISMAFIAASLLFFPVILKMAGTSIFGDTTTAGTSGTIGV